MGVDQHVAQCIKTFFLLQINSRQVVGLFIKSEGGELYEGHMHVQTYVSYSHMGSFG